MGKYEVTQGEWSRIVGAFPHEMDKGAGGDFPVYWVNYTEADEFARNLTAMARKIGELPREWNSGCRRRRNGNTRAAPAR